ncbi:MAG: DUF4288 domain-containing protein [Nitrospira sp.]|nr:DUF4288 domain-containing protein [Nitrospira sp.]
MTWYAAHLVIGIMPIQKSAETILVHENVVLVEASSESDALGKAEAIGLTEANLQDGMTMDGVPAKRLFAGIRKLITVSNPETNNLDQDRPSDGTEITYSVYKVSNEEELKKLATGLEVQVKYIE